MFSLCLTSFTFIILLLLLLSHGFPLLGNASSGNDNGNKGGQIEFIYRNLDSAALLAQITKEEQEDIYNEEDDTQSVSDDELWEGWKHEMFVNDTNKANEEQNNILSLRKRIFLRRSRKLQYLNKRLSNKGKATGGSTVVSNNMTFAVGLNMLAAMTSTELKSLTGLIPLAPGAVPGSTVGDDGNLQPNSNDSLVFSGSLSNEGETIPSSVDWRTVGAVSDVKMQGLCGGCWAFAATGVIEGLFYQQNGFLLTFSEQELLDCDTEHNLGCTGGNFYYSFNDYYLQSASGIALGLQYPYTALTQTVSTKGPDTCSNMPQTGFLTASKVLFLQQNDATLAAAISRGPVAVAVSGYSDVFQFYTGGIINSDECGTTVDHAVLAVGYTDDYFILKNSWGPRWGEDGFVRVARGPGSNGLGYCGILTQINEFDTTVDVGCRLSSTGVTTGMSPCEKYESSLFCTTDYGCRNSSFYYDLGFISPQKGLLANGTLSPSDSNAENAVVAQSLIILSATLSTVFAIGSLATGYALWRRRANERKSELPTPSDYALGPNRVRVKSPTVQKQHGRSSPLNGAHPEGEEDPKNVSIRITAPILTSTTHRRRSSSIERKDSNNTQSFETARCTEIPIPESTTSQGTTRKRRNSSLSATVNIDDYVINRTAEVASMLSVGSVPIEWGWKLTQLALRLSLDLPVLVTLLDENNGDLEDAYIQGVELTR
jgi:hypothetical protein